MLFLGLEESPTEEGLEDESLFDPTIPASGNIDVFDVTFQLFDKVHQQVRDKKNKITATTHRLRRRLNRKSIQGELQGHVGQLKKKLQEPPVVALRNKLSFYLGVNTVCITIWLLSKHPETMAIVYLWQFLALISARVYIYRRQGYGYFTLDLCYFVNILTLLYLFVLPDHPVFLAAVFNLCHGPLIWAILQWRNSLVFHSLDKITSCFIHGYPCLALYTVRWLLPKPYLRQHYPAILMSTPPCIVSWASSLGLYVVWQLAYYSIVNIFNGEKVMSGSRVTSYTWILAAAKSQGPRNWLYRTLNCFGPKYSYAIFMTLQFMYTMITILPTPIYWSSFTTHTSILLLMLNVAIWNGANYYVEVFGKSYAKQFKDLHSRMVEALDETNEQNDASDVSSNPPSSATSPALMNADAPPDQPRDKGPTRSKYNATLQHLQESTNQNERDDPESKEE